MASEFRFSYTMFSVTASLDGTHVTAQMGRKRFSFELAGLKYVFVKSHGGQFQELIAAFEVETGQFSHLRLFSNAGEFGFRQFVDALAAACPGGDLRGRPDAEAFALLRARDNEKVALVAVPLVLLAAVAILLSPFLVHGLDTGRATISASALASGQRPASRNLDLTGPLDLEHAVEVETTQSGRTSGEVLVPVIDPSWPADHPVAVVLTLDTRLSGLLRELAGRDSVPCTLRNVLWEGADSEQLAFFTKVHGLTVSSDVLSCEYTSRPRDELTMFVIGMSIGGGVVLIVTVALLVRRRRLSR